MTTSEQAHCSTVATARVARAPVSVGFAGRNDKYHIKLVSKDKASVGCSLHGTSSFVRVACGVGARVISRMRSSPAVRLSANDPGTTVASLYMGLEASL